MNVTAFCERSGDWWAVMVPEVEGVFTQAKRLDQVPAMVADAVHLLAGVPADDVHVEIKARVPEPSALALWADASEEAERARGLQEEAAAKARSAVVALRERGLSVRDVTSLLDVSPQRVSQLAGHGDRVEPVDHWAVITGVMDEVLVGRAAKDAILGHGGRVGVDDVCAVGVQASKGGGSRRLAESK